MLDLGGEGGSSGAIGAHLVLQQTLDIGALIFTQPSHSYASLPLQIPPSSTSCNSLSPASTLYLHHSWIIPMFPVIVVSLCIVVIAPAAKHSLSPCPGHANGI